MTKAPKTLAQTFQPEELQLADERMAEIYKATLAVDQALRFLQDLSTESSPSSVRDRTEQARKNLAIADKACCSARVISSRESVLLAKRERKERVA